MGDCMVVKSDMFEVKMKTSVKRDKMMRIPRVLDTCTGCVLPVSVNVLDVSDVGRSGDRSDGVVESDVMVVESLRKDTYLKIES